MSLLLVIMLFVINQAWVIDYGMEVYQMFICLVFVLNLVQYNCNGLVIISWVLVFGVNIYFVDIMNQGNFVFDFVNMMDIFFMVVFGLFIFGMDYIFVVILECDNSIVVFNQGIIEGGEI